MDSRNVHKEDILKDYIDPERIEKAPEGFTLKTMARIRIEAGAVTAHSRFWIRNLIPLITVIVTVALTASVMLTPEKNAGSIFDRFAEKLGVISFPFPLTGIDVLPSFDMPSLIVYVTIGIIILTLFDGLLSFIFHRERK